MNHTPNLAGRPPGAGPNQGAAWRGALAALALLATVADASAQAATTLKTLVDTHGSLSAGDLTITNFRTPYGPPVGLADVRTYGKGDDVAVRAELAADGRVNLVFTPVDPLTALPRPAFVDAANGAAASPNQAYNVTYDVVVNNPLRKLHAVDSGWGPGTVSTSATEAINAVYYFNAGGGNAVCLCLVYLDQFRGTQFVSGRPAGGVPLPQTESWAVIGGTGDYSAYRFGNQWGLISGPWGGVRFGQASLDNLTMSFTLAPAMPAVGAPVMDDLFADAVFLSGPAGPGGVTIALRSSDPTLAAVPATVTVLEGALYARIPVVDGVVPFPAYAFITGTLAGTSRTVSYEVWPTVWPPAGPPQPSLTVTKAGSGSVSSADKKFSCGSKCSVTYATGTIVALTAQPASNSHFVGWGGACSGTALTCSVAVTDPGMAAVATFEGNAAAGGGGGGGGGGSQFTLQVNKINLGTVTSDFAGIACGGSCSARYAQSTAVTLTATAPAGKSFVGWGGACSGTVPVCSLTIGANASVQAIFSK